LSPPALPPAVSGERRTFTGRAGPLSTYVAGTGAPLLLVHSINAAGSAYEVSPIFERMKGSRRVYAPDLPGFGFSDRSDRLYSPRLYTDAIHDMLDQIAVEAGGAPVDALALSLSGEFLARAAVEKPERFRTLTLVTPTGFEKGAHLRRGPDDANREIPGVYRVLTVPLWSQGLYGLLVSRVSIRYFLQRTFGRKDVPEDLVDYDYATAHQPGARFAPLAFVSGRLFSRDVRSLYERLTMRVWLAHGTKGDFSDFAETDWTRSRPNWRVQPFGTGALPHFEVPDAFIAGLEAFLAEPPPASSPPP
jgi:pimeloyl-ACP methyl ester carboxylesterase